MNAQVGSTVGPAGGSRRSSDSVEFAILPAQAVDQRVVVGRGAGDALDQHRGTISLALSVNLLAEPAEKAMRITLCQGIVQAAQRGIGCGIELGRVDIAECIGREIADEPGASVNVLEATLRIAAWGHTQDFPVLLIPGPGQFVNRQAPVRRSCSSSNRMMMCKL